MKFILKSLLPFLFILFFCFINLNCNKEYCYPDCISEQITAIERSNLPGSYISEYWFQGQKVFYVFTGYSPDEQYAVINSDCEVIGYLEGFIGNTIIKGDDFIKNAKLIKVLWRRHKWQ